MKPGAHGLIWSLPRTSHWTAWALEDAGFEVRDCLYHLVSGDAKLATFVESLTDEQRNAFTQLVDSQDEQVTSTLAIFGAGFPKSHNISIAIDRYFKAEREITGISPNARPAHKLGGMAFDKAVGKEEHSTIKLTAPATSEAQKYAGWGSNLKPAVENWLLVRKPLSEKTIAENILKWGVGGLNIDACRVTMSEADREIVDNRSGSDDGIRNNIYHNGVGMREKGKMFTSHSQGRWPSHLLLSHSIFCVPNGTKRVPIGGGKPIAGELRKANIYGQYELVKNTYHGDADGMEEVEDWICDASCPILQLDEQSGRRSMGHIPRSGKEDSIWGNGKNRPLAEQSNNGYNDQGGASRYFKQFYYGSKASRKDRTANGTVENTHPTCKNTELIRYLTRMICPPGGIVLDCFAGSGTTALACISEGFDYLLIEQELEYVNIAKKRIDQILQDVNNAS
jgi:site-specific DNA-methyltransferase (adenine-specific)